MPLQATSGAASYDGFGGGVPFVPTYIEEVFSTYLYTGNGGTQTITNGIDLSTKGGLTWIKQRSAARNNLLFDTVRGATKPLYSNLTNAEGSDAQSLTAFTSTGFSIGSDSGCNINAGTYASWTFREQAKFFDVVTYTGNGVAGRTVSHNLGAVPGCMIVKRTDGATNWRVYHRSLGATQYLDLDETVAAGTATTIWNDTAPTSTVFSVGTNSGVNANGGTYVAYLFAHNAGGFGLTGTDNVISCGSYTGNGSATGPTVTLGYEPQLVMVKRSDAAANWVIFDNMRGMSETTANLLYPNLTDDEGIGTQGWVVPTATGFKLAITQSVVNASGGTYIYIAIRRGPMKTPTSGTSVFAPVVYAGNGTSQTITTGFANDMEIIRRRASAENNVIEDKLRGSRVLFTNTTDSELTSTGDVTGYTNTGFTLGASNQGSTNDGGGPSYISWNFARAPGFFDEVCYTGTGAQVTLNHNLTVVPELVIFKSRSTTTDWVVYRSTATNKRLDLNSSNAEVNEGAFGTFTSTTMTLNVDGNINSSTAGRTYVAYLFATVAGVSKVGSYTGTGTTLQIDCGFTGGARFVLIKRTDSTGDWYVWDSARGIVAGNDPYLLLNSTAAEVTNTDYIDTYSAGFEISSTAPAAINANGGSFVFLAIA